MTTPRQTPAPAADRVPSVYAAECRYCRRYRRACGRHEASATLVRVAIVRCGCGHFPLDQVMHRTPAQAWQAAAAHVALTGKCTPAMGWDEVSPGIAAQLPAGPAPAVADFVAV